MFHEENAPFHGEVEGRENFTQAVAREGRRPHIPSHTPPLIANLIRKCWLNKAEDRYVKIRLVQFEISPTDAFGYLCRPSMNSIVDSHVFDHCIIQTSLGKDLKASELWLTSFFGQYEVKWPKFVRTLWNFLGKQWVEGKSEREGSYLAVSLAFSDTAVVTIEQFARVLETYGPLVGVRPALREADKSATPRSTTLVDRCFEYWSCPGFFGDISVREAEQYLTASVQKGMYLIRFSADGSLAVATCRGLTASSSANNLTASNAMSDSPSFVHFKICVKHEEQCFEFNNACFTSLESLIISSLGKICRKVRRQCELWEESWLSSFFRVAIRK